MARQSIQDEMRLINNELRKQKLKSFLGALKHLDFEKAIVSYNKANEKLLDTVENIQEKNVYALPKMMSEIRKNCEFQMKLSNEILSAFTQQEYDQEYHWNFIEEQKLDPIGCEDVNFIEYKQTKDEEKQ